MLIITMERKTMDGEPVEHNPVYENGEDIREWWCVIKTKEEEMVYDDFIKYLGQHGGDPRDLLWNKMVIHAGQGMGVDWGDDEIYGYIRPDEDYPDIGEKFIDGDGDTWVRVE